MKTPILILLLAFLVGKNTAFSQFADSLKIKGLVHEGTGSNLLNNGVLMAIKLGTQKTIISSIVNGVIDIDSLGQGGYYLYAVPNPFSSTAYLPTYFVNKIDPNQAAYVSMTGSVSDLDVYLVAKTVSETGTSTLNGRFYYWEGESDAGTDFSKKWFNTPTPPSTISISGNSCNTLPVLLYNSQNQIVSWTITDTQGYFQFHNLAGGTYYAKGQRNEYMNRNDGFVTITSNTTKESTFSLWRGLATQIETEQLVIQNETVYPNPFKDQLQLSFDGRMLITDLSGSVWYDQYYVQNQQIDAAAWPKGIYFVKTGNKVQKLVKQ